jgi:hypothetical protein
MSGCSLAPGTQRRSEPDLDTLSPADEHADRMAAPKVSCTGVFHSGEHNDPEPSHQVEKSFFKSALGSVHCWWGICLFSAGILGWSARHSMNPDGLSYLDLASRALSGGPTALVNGYWSPGYPALISLALFLFHPSPSQEFPLIHFVNFLVFIFTLWAFSFFFRSWLVTPHGDEVVIADQTSFVTAFAFSTFLWFTLRFIGIGIVTPDLGVAAVVFLAAGIGCRLSLPGSSWKHSVGLGFVLGVGYYLKEAMFPLGLAFLVLVFFLSPLSKKVSWQKLLLSFSVFLLVATPLTVALSIRANRVTFGEAGRLNYLWFVNGRLWTGVLRVPEDFKFKPHTTPEHPAPKLLTTPVTLEFAYPTDNGTYPLWYDPSYWYSDARVGFDWNQQVAALKENLLASKNIVVGTLGFVVGAIVLCAVIIRKRLYSVTPRISWWQLAWPLVACSMYALVYVEPRYLGPFLVLFWMAVYRALMFRVNRGIAAAVCGTVLFFNVIVPFTAYLTTAAVRSAKDIAHPRPPEYQIAAVGLSDLGLRNSDRLAIVGYAYDCYWARYDRLRVVAQIPDAHEFWRLSAPELKSLAERLASDGVKAVVVSNRPDGSAHADWKDVKVSDSLRLSVLLLSPEASKPPD